MHSASETEWAGVSGEAAASDMLFSPVKAPTANAHSVQLAECATGTHTHIGTRLDVFLHRD